MNFGVMCIQFVTTRLFCLQNMGLIQNIVFMVLATSIAARKFHDLMQRL